MDKADKFRALAAWLQQPSSKRGLAGLAGLAGMTLNPDHWEAIGFTMALVIFLYEFFRKGAD